MKKVFILSPASCAGRRARALFRDGTQLQMARQLSEGGVAIAEVFTYLSSLYFRGKIAYARAFADTDAGGAPRVITSSQGLLWADAIVTLEDLRSYAAVSIGAESAHYRDALARSADRLGAELAADGRAVLLGSIATGKYTDVLLGVFGERLCFPAAFVGRGDMSRGGLMLRCAVDGQELDYVPVAGAARRGSRPPKLAPRRR